MAKAADAARLAAAAEADVQRATAERLGREIASHPSVQQEQRRVALVRAKLAVFTAEEMSVLRYILDHGEVRLLLLEASEDRKVVHSALRKATLAELVEQRSEDMTIERYVKIKPPFELALGVVLGDQVS
jgi:hypothetical protein